jgi:hypothetical protein
MRTLQQAALALSLLAIGDDVMAQGRPPMITTGTMRMDTKEKVKEILVKHFPNNNADGWKVAQTEWFRFFHKESYEECEAIARIAEKTRLDMHRKWFGGDGEAWHAPCEVVIHRDVESYTQLTQVPGTSPGHSRIETDPGGRIVSRRVDVRSNFWGMKENILPHEITHVVLAGQFNGKYPPRFADEGIAVLSEPQKQIDQHLKNFANTDPAKIFGMKELMELGDYPKPSRVPTFYAQSVSVTHFLTAKKDPVTLTNFLRTAGKKGYEAASQEHYGVTLAELEREWKSPPALEKK